MFAIVSAKEDYDTLKVSCSEVFKEINDLISKLTINVAGKEIPLEFYLSGDYKVNEYYYCTLLLLKPSPKN